MCYEGCPSPVMYWVNVGGGGSATVIVSHCVPMPCCLILFMLSLPMECAASEYLGLQQPRVGNQCCDLNQHPLPANAPLKQLTAAVWCGTQ